MLIDNMYEAQLIAVNTASADHCEYRFSLKRNAMRICAENLRNTRHPSGL